MQNPDMIGKSGSEVAGTMGCAITTAASHFRFLAEATDDRSYYFIKVKYMIKSYLDLDADVWPDDHTTYCTHRVTGTKTTLSSLFCRRMKCSLRIAYLGG